MASNLPSDHIDPLGGADKPKRRRKGTRLSCAECRRLKLRCDRSVPCGSCVKRGCSAICPDGSLTTGQGNRFVLASTQELHEKISQLANRVRELEDALRSSHTQHSSEIHPLLTEELLQIKAPLQREFPSNKNGALNMLKDEEPNPDIVDAFGSLSISLSGRTKYFGHIANSYYFLQNQFPESEEPDDQLTKLESILPPDILKRSACMPISSPAHTSFQADSSVRDLFWYLPAAEKAAELRSVYFRHAAWMYNPISPEAFNEQVYSQFYNENPSATANLDDRLFSHRQALLFMVFAIGSLMNTAEPAYNIDAEKYHQLARASLFSDSLFEDLTVDAIQALFLMAFYLFLAERHGTSSGSRWALMGLAVKMAQSIGLHRDSGRFRVDPTETQRRRELFWELYTYDSWQCLTFGRPPSFSLAHIDCKLPFPREVSDDQSFHSWKHRFSSECMSVVHDQAFGAKTPVYATILQLDRKIRAFPVPPILQVVGFGSSDTILGGFPETTMLTLQRHIVLAIRETNLLYLHRGFFARAVSDHPKDPLGSPYGTSVIAAYRSAGSLIQLMRNLHTQLKEPSERIWFLWTHMFSCAIVLGSIVTRCPSISFAPSALSQLESACELFSKAARVFRAEKALSVMVGLRDKARISLSDFKKGKISLGARQLSPETPSDDGDELDTLGGRTRLVAQKRSSNSPPLMDRSPTSLHPVIPLPLGPTYDNQVHPSVVEYLRTFATQAMVSEPDTMVMPPSTSNPSYAESSLYGLTSIPLPHTTSRQSPLQQHLQPFSPAPHDPTSYRPMADATSFPQYFPVYDYTSTGSHFGYNPMQMDSSGDTPPMNSPEANMHTTWNDFVAGLAMN